MRPLVRLHGVISALMVVILMFTFISCDGKNTLSESKTPNPGITTPSINSQDTGNNNLNDVPVDPEWKPPSWMEDNSVEADKNPNGEHSSPAITIPYAPCDLDLTVEPSTVYEGEYYEIKWNVTDYYSEVVWGDWRTNLRGTRIPFSGHEWRNISIAGTYDITISAYHSETQSGKIGLFGGNTSQMGDSGNWCTKAVTITVKKRENYNPESSVFNPTNPNPPQTTTTN